MAQKSRDIGTRLLAAEAMGPEALFEALSSARFGASGGTMYRLTDWLSRSKRPHFYLAATWRITRNLYAAPHLPPIDLAGEIEWASIVLQTAEAAVRDFLDFKKSLEISVLHADWRSATRLIDDFEGRQGASLIAEELRLAVIQLSLGTGPQVVYARRLEARSTASLFHWFIRLASLRNEEHVSFQGFTRTFEELMRNSDLEAGQVVQFGWHAKRQLPDTPELLAELLARESVSSTFDYYECLVAVCASVIFRKDLDPFRKATLNALARLQTTSDPRVLNALGCLDSKRKKLPMQSPAKYPNDVAVLFEGHPSVLAPTAPMSQLRDELFQLLYSEQITTVARFSMPKFGANLFPLTVPQIVHSFWEQYVENKNSHLAISPGVSINGYPFTPWHALSLPADLRARQLERFARDEFSSKESALLAATLLRVGNAPSAAVLMEPRLGVEATIQLAQAGSFDELASLCASKAAEMPMGDYARELVILCDTCRLPNDAETYLAAAVKVCRMRPDLYRAATSRRTLEQIKPMLISARSAMYFCLAAWTLLDENESDKLQDKLLVAVERIVRDGNQFLGNIADNPLALDESWPEFLYRGLTLNNITLVDGITSMRLALTFRSAVLRHLMAIGPDDQKRYEEELKDISFDLVIDEGMRHVDQSRLYVNLDGLKRWATEQVKEDVERFRELAKVDILAAFGGRPPDQIEESGDALLEKLTKLPRTASDDQLIQVLARLKAAYLTHPRYGLEAFISLRVRHGTLAGTLGAPFDEKHLLLIRSSVAGRMMPPEHWFQELGMEDETCRSLVEVYFWEFTNVFQTLIDDLLQKKVRVRSTKYAEGLIDVDVTEVLVKGVKFDIAEDTSFEDVLELIFLAYKNSASNHLRALRTYLSGEFSLKVLLAAERLDVQCRAALPTISGNRLGDSITAAMNSFRSAVVKVCGWLEIAHKDDLSQLFSVRQIVAIAIDYTKRVRVGFDPRIDIDIEQEDVPLAGRSLVVLVHAIFILLDNVYQHGGSPSGGSVRIRVRMPSNHIQICVENDLADHVSADVVREEFGKARELIDNEAERGLHLTEGHSGFPKLKQLTSAGDAEGLVFNVSENTVAVTLRVPFSTIEVTPFGTNPVR